MVGIDAAADVVALARREADRQGQPNVGFGISDACHLARQSPTGSVPSAGLTTGSGRCAPRGSSRRDVRERSMSRHTRATTVVSHPAKDAVQAKVLYGALLGVAPQLDEAYYAAASVPETRKQPWIRTRPSQGLTEPVALVQDADGNVTGLIQSP